MITRISQWSYATLFVIIASVAGFLFMVVTPPFQSPDEPNHYFRSFQIASGRLIGVMHDWHYGGFLPKQLQTFPDLMMRTESGMIPFHKDIKFPIEKIFQGFALRKDLENMSFIGFPNTASYPFMMYLPHALGIFLGKIMVNSELAIFYSGRLFGLLCYVLCGFHILRSVAKPYLEIFFLSLLLPMSLYLGAMITADTATILAAFAASAYSLTQRHRSIPITQKNIWPHFFFAVILGLVKPVYAVVVGLVFLVPFSPASSWLKNSLMRCGLVAITFLEVLGVVFLGKGAEFSLRDDILVNPGLQLDVVLHHPIKFLGVAGTYFFERFPVAVQQLVGVFGWLDTIMPWLGYGLGVSLIVLTVIKKDPEERRFSWKELGLILLVIVGAILGTLFFLFLVWSPAGEWTIDGFQGRYLLPVLPLGLIVARHLIGRKFSISKWLLMGGFIILLGIAITAIVSRFY